MRAWLMRHLRRVHWYWLKGVYSHWYTTASAGSPDRIEASLMFLGAGDRQVLQVKYQTYGTALPPVVRIVGVSRFKQTGEIFEIPVASDSGASLIPVWPTVLRIYHYYLDPSNFAYVEMSWRDGVLVLNTKACGVASLNRIELNGVPQPRKD